MVGIEVIICLAWTLDSPPTPTVLISSTALEWTCESSTDIYKYILIVYNAILIIIGMILATLTRNVLAEYSESQLIGYASFTFAIGATVSLPLFALPGLNYSNKMVILFGATHLLGGIIIIVFCGSKILGILREHSFLPKESENAFLSDGGVDSSGGGKRSILQGKTSEVDITRLFARKRGYFTRWHSCVLLRSVALDFFLIRNMEDGKILISGTLSNSTMVDIAEEKGVDCAEYKHATGWLCYRSERVRIQAHNKEILETFHLGVNFAELNVVNSD
jgi:hypothetical protein